MTPAAALLIVTATTNPGRARAAIESWGDVDKVIVVNGPRAADPLPAIPRTTWIRYRQGYLGSVPAFRTGVTWALDETAADVIACLHDDLELRDPAWAEKVRRHFARTPKCGLAGFGGAIGLGAEDLYEKAYRPMALARIGFRSNLVDAETHGIRSLLTERVACLDGFSQIGRREFWNGQLLEPDGVTGPIPPRDPVRPLPYLERAGMIHHAYDSALGVWAASSGWETWYLPIAAHHAGGQTAVGDPGYQAWAETQITGGDGGFWTKAHEALYAFGRGILPLRV